MAKGPRKQIGPQRRVTVGKKRVQRKVPRLMYRGMSNGKHMYSLEKRYKRKKS